MCHWPVVLCVLRVLVLVPLLVHGDMLELVGLFVEVVPNRVWSFGGRHNRVCRRVCCRWF